jgi:SagB-type dehydrogenase family enzyme
MLLVAFLDGGEETAITDEIRSRYGIPSAEIAIAIEILANSQLLVSPQESTHVRVSAIMSTWADFGWVDAADYQIATLNYPFADYSRDGREIDFQRMVQYVREAPDTNRAKSYGDAELRISAPSAADALKQFGESFAAVWHGNPVLEVCDRNKCLSLLSTVFGKLRNLRLADDVELMADAIGKTSPSGGARHPTEAYLIALEVDGLDRAIYHFNSTESTLDKIADFHLTEPEIQSHFSGPLRASFSVDALIVMTSVFDRSMYRYREPRSFRAIYMDVGHLCGTLDVSAKALRLNCLAQHGLSDAKVGQLLGLDPLIEGVIYGAAIGGSQMGKP